MTEAPYDKAIQETAKTMGKTVDAASGAGKFVARVFGGTLQELADWSRDAVALKRLEWKANNVDRAIQSLRTLKGAGAAINPLPDRQASIVLEAIANEDDDDIQRLWVSLIDRATDPSSGYDIKRVHIDVLRSIDPAEARILTTVKRYIETNSSTRTIDGHGLAGDVGIDDRDLIVFLHHLATLGCFIATDKTVGLAIEQSPIPPVEINTQTADFQFTDLLLSLFEVIF